MNHFQKIAIALVIGVSFSAGAKGAQKLPDYLVGPGEHGYSRELVARGVQGTTLVRVVFGEAGRILDAAIEESSRSNELDQLALSVGRGLEVVGDGKVKGPVPVLVPVVFMKDSLETLNSKSCGDFVVDYAYFASTFPEKQGNKMPLISQMGGLLLVTRPELFRRFSENEGAVVTRVLEKCRGQPAQLFAKTFTQQVAAGER